MEPDGSNRTAHAKDSRLTALARIDAIHAHAQQAHICSFALLRITRQVIRQVRERGLILLGNGGCALLFGFRQQILQLLRVQALRLRKIGGMPGDKIIYFSDSLLVEVLIFPLWILLLTWICLRSQRIMCTEWVEQQELGGVAERSHW